MDISKFIEKLEEIKKEHGDISVNVFDSERMADAELVECQAHLSLHEDKDGKITSVTVVDSETYLAFANG